MLLSGYVKARLDKDETGDLKRFILDFLKASDFNIEDVVLHEGELITPELEQLIQNVPIGNGTKRNASLLLFCVISNISSNVLANLDLTYFRAAIASVCSLNVPIPTKNCV